MKTSTSTTLVSTLIALATLPLFVNAHGFVTELTVTRTGQRYVGSDLRQGYRAAGSSVIRQVEDNSPVPGADSPMLACGRNAQPASDSADVMPGDDLLLTWGPTWPHRVGPFATYMASCGSVTCDKFDHANARWFKTSEHGQRPGSTEWFQADIANGKPMSARIPDNLAPGNYLLRSEIIALHLGAEPNGAELFASCAQLRVGGSGTGRPSESELVNIPGAYTASDPGLYTPTIYEPGFKYTFSGPAISRLAGNGGAPPANDAPAPPPSPNVEQPAPVSPPAPTVNNGAAAPTNFDAAPAPTSAATTTSVAAPPALPSTIRRCKKRPTAKQRRERAAARAAAAAAAASPSPVAVNIVETPPTLPKRGHHSRIMRRFAHGSH